MTIEKKDITCPTCKKTNTWTAENKFKPFCSEHCKLIDLGEWASESYKVAGEKTDPNVAQDNKDSEE